VHGPPLTITTTNLHTVTPHPPAVILSPTSLTEFPAYWAEHPEEFASISEGATEEERMVRVLRWFIGTLKGQYTVRFDRLNRCPALCPAHPRVAGLGLNLARALPPHLTFT
jgi:hypothetical protein